MGKYFKNLNNEKEERVLEKIAYLRNIKGLPKIAAKILKKYLSSIPANSRTPELYLLLANLYIDIGKTKKALAGFRIAAQKAKLKSNKLLLANILRKWGYLYLHTEKNLSKAADKINESVKIIDEIMRCELNNEILRVAANCYASLGNYHYDSNALKSAKDAYRKAIKLGVKSKFKERIITVLGDLGNVAIREKKWNEAEKLLKKTKGRAEKYYQHALPSSLVRLGYLFMNTENPAKNTEKAENYIKESLEVAKKSGWKREQADALLAFGKLKIIQGKSKEGENYIKKAEKIYNAINHHRDTLEKP